MRHRSRLGILTVVATAAVLTFVQPAHAADPAPPADFLAPAQQAAQCAKPLASRVGNWWCPTTTTASAAMVLRNARAAGVATEVTVNPLSSYCKVEGCWTKIDDGHSTFQGTGSYGSGLTHLGDTQLYFKVILSGAKHNSYPFWFKSTRGTKNIVLSGERLYLSAAYPQGHSTSPRLFFSKTFATAAANVSVQWPSPGPSTYENTVTWMTIAHEATWSDPSSAYPGHWYMWAKSIKNLKQPSGAYYVQDSNALPSQPTGGGWGA